jgi:histone acetyltransferase
LLEKKVNEPFVRRNAQGEEEYFRINPLEIPGVKESGWNWQDHEDLIKTKEVSFLLECQNILDLFKKHQASWPFREPVSLDDVPDYHLVVKEPMDSKTIEKKLSSNSYRDR